MADTNDELRKKAEKILQQVYYDGNSDEDLEWGTPDEEYINKLMQLIQSDREKAVRERIESSKSFCGCTMCEHHSTAFEAQLNKEDA